MVVSFLAQKRNETRDKEEWSESVNKGVSVVTVYNCCQYTPQQKK